MLKLLTLHPVLLSQTHCRTRTLCSPQRFTSFIPRTDGFSRYILGTGTAGANLQPSQRHSAPVITVTKIVQALFLIVGSAPFRFCFLSMVKVTCIVSLGDTVSLSIYAVISRNPSHYVPYASILLLFNVIPICVHLREPSVLVIPAADTVQISLALFLFFYCETFNTKDTPEHKLILKKCLEQVKLKTTINYKMMLFYSTS